MAKPATIAEYLDAAPEAGQPTLRELYAILRAAAPHATESIKWGQPTFDGARIIFCFAGYRDHANFMPTPDAIAAFQDEIAALGLRATKGVLMMDYDRALPAELVRRIAEHRVVAERAGAKFMV